MFKGIDLFSDTLTKPTAGMRKAMIEAEVGDEQKGEDPTTRRLEEMIAEMLGFSAAMFFPSATMANEIAIRALCDDGDELLASQQSHLFLAEAGGPAIHSGVMCKPIMTPTGLFTGADVKEFYRWSTGPHYPISKLLSVENTANMGGGIAWTLDQLNDVVTAANELKLKKHMDGARLFNACVKVGKPAKTVVAGFDMVTVCLSKGLGCPVGAVLLFDKAFYTRIRRLKQLMGGAMRQSGILAAAGIYALQHHIERLSEDHENAAELARGLKEMGPNIKVVETPNPTNMVFFHWESPKISADEFRQTCEKNGVRFSQVGLNKFRAVTHLDITKENIQQSLQVLKKIASHL